MRVRGMWEEKQHIEKRLGRERKEILNSSSI